LTKKCEIILKKDNFLEKKWMKTTLTTQQNNKVVAVLLNTVLEVLGED